MKQLFIRKYKPEDESAIRQICFNTAFYGQSIKNYFRDKNIITELFLGYYIRFEPKNILVAVINKKIAGYLTGCFNTKAYERMIILILPKICWHFLIKGYFFRADGYKLVKDSIKSALKWNKFHQNSLLKLYPAHFHIDIDEQFQGHGIGARLVKKFLDLLKENKIYGVHLDTATSGGKKFFSKIGFKVINKYKTPSFFGFAPKELWVMVKKIKNN